MTRSFSRTSSLGNPMTRGANFISASLTGMPGSSRKRSRPTRNAPRWPAGWEEERFMAQLETGRISVRLEKPETVVLELLAAYNLRPTRAEPLYELARYYRMRKGYRWPRYSPGRALPTPRPNDRLFVIDSVYVAAARRARRGNLLDQSCNSKSA